MAEPVPASRIVKAQLKAEEEQRRRMRAARDTSPFTSYSKLSPLGDERDSRGHIIDRGEEHSA